MSVRFQWKTDFSTRNGMGVWAREMCYALDRAGVEICAGHEGPAFEAAKVSGSASKAERLRRWLSVNRALPAIHARHGSLSWLPVNFERPAIFDDLGLVNVLLWPSDPRVMAPEWIDKANRVFDQLWCDSTYTQEMMIRAGGDPIKVKLVQGGIDTDLFVPPAVPQERHEFVFLNVAGPQWLQKGFDILISAFSEEFSPAEPAALHLYIKPHDHFIAQAQNYIDFEVNRLGRRPRIELRSAVYEYEQMAQVYASGDCYVQPSRTESFGLPALEAACCGLPIIVTGKGGMTDFARHETAFQIEYDECPMPEGAWKGNYAGTWFEPRRDHLRRLLRLVYEQRDALRPAARTLAAQLRTEWTWENAARRALPILEGLWSLVEMRG